MKAPLVVLGIVTAVFSTALVPGVAPPSEAAPVTRISRVSFNEDGTQRAQRSRSPSISGDGRMVAFSSGDGAGTSQIYVHDRGAGTTSLASVAADGSPLTGNGEPGLSADASHLAFRSDSPSLDGSRVLVKNLATGELDNVSDGLAGSVGAPAISADARYVVFQVAKTIHLVDRTTGDRTVIFTTSDANREVFDPAISDDGSTVAYTVTPGRFFAPKLFIYDVGAGTTNEVPDRSAWREAPALSADGMLVAFQSRTSAESLYVFDRATGASVAVPTRGSDTEMVSLSDDGRHVAYFGGTRFEGGDIFRTDRSTGEITLVSATPVGAAGNGESHSPDIDASGASVAFASEASNLVDGDTNGVEDVFVSVDASPPTWPAGSSLAAEDVGRTQLKLVWTEATDDAGVAGYRIFQDGSPIGDVGRSPRSHLVTGLTPATSYDFAVEALDAAGNVSTGGPTTRVRTQAGGGLAALSVDTAPGGLATLRWEASAAADLAGYRIQRANGGGFADVGDVGASSTSFEDRGLAAETAYRWRVLTIDSSGATAPHTNEATATTPALVLDAVSARAPLIGFTTAVLGSDLVVTATGEPNRIATATVEFGTVAIAVAAADDPIPLAEVAPGTYRGSVEIADGVVEITSVEAVLTDGAGHVARASAPGLPRPVSGRADVTIVLPADAPPGALDGTRIVGDSAAARSGNGVAVDGTGPVALPLAAADDYRIRLLEPDGREAAAADGVAVEAGRATAVTLRPVFRGSVAVRVLDPHGSVVPGAFVTLRRAGAYLGFGSTGEDGTTEPLARVVSGTEIGVQAVPPEGLQLGVGQTTRTIHAGENLVTVSLRTLPPGRVVGRILRSGGAAVPGANVTVNQQVDDRWWTFTGATDEDGRFAIDALAGRADVSASFPGLQGAGVPGAVVPSGGEVSVRLTLIDLRTYVLQLGLFTEYAGAPRQGPLPIDGSLAALLQLQILGTGPNLRPAGGSVPIRAVPGDEIRFCSTGVNYPSSLRPGCSAVTLGQDPVVPIDLVLTEGRAVLARLAKPDGTPWDISWTAVVRRDGATIDRFYSRGERVRIAVPEPGTYELEVVGCCTLRGSARRTFTVSSALTDIGTLTLRTGQRFVSAANSIVVSNQGAPTGEPADIRATFHNDLIGFGLGAVARLEVPTGTSLVPGSVTLNGAQVGFEERDGFASVGLGDLAGGAGGVLRYQLRLDAAAGTGIPVTARFSVTGEPEETVGPAFIEIAGVTLNAPRFAPALHVPVSGRAPANTMVTVFDGQAVVAVTQSSDAGFWDALATLPDRRLPPVHELHAVSDVAGSQLVSESKFVEVDPTRPRLVTVTLEHHGRSIAFDPGQGVARFPLVVVPGEPTMVAAEFDNPDRVVDVRARYGDEEVLAVKDAGGVFRATLVETLQGGLSVDFDVVPTPIALDPPVTDDEVRESLPDAFRDFEVQPPDPGAPPPPEGTAEAIVAFPSLPGLEANVAMSVERDVAYTPTAADLEFEQRTGAPLYGVRVQHTQSSNHYAADIELIVPESALQGSASTSSNRVSASADVVKFAKLAIKFIMDFADSPLGQELAQGADLPGLLTTSLGLGQRYQTLDDLEQQVEMCGGPFANLRADRINAMRAQALELDAVDVASTIVSAAVGAFNLLAGIGVGALFLFLSTGLDRIFNDTVASLEQDMAATENLCEDEPPSPDPDTADPEELYDPSGYVFEAVPSNRLPGVTATVLTGPSPDGPFAPWPAERFGQANPMTTNDAGRYGWDVPPGWWQVAYTKDGYGPAFSDVLRVLPPHFDVNVGMVSFAAPGVADVAAFTGPDQGVDVRFDKYMIPATVLIRVDGIDGAVVPVDAEAAPDGTIFARTYRFVPDRALVEGETLTVGIDSAAQSYAGVPMAATVEREAVAGERPPAPPDEPEPGFAPNPDGTRPFVPAFSPTPFFSLAPGADSPPVVAPLISPAANPAGWHRGDVTAGWTVRDDETGIASTFGCDEVVLHGETAGRMLTCAARNGDDVVGLASALVRIDRTAPECTAETKGGRRQRGRFMPVSIRVRTDDALSGVERFALVSATSSGKERDIRDFDVGTPDTKGRVRAVAGRVYTFVYEVVDVAGNTGRCQVDVTIERRRRH